MKHPASALRLPLAAAIVVLGLGLGLGLGAAPARAEPPPGDPIAEKLFPPELIMAHQQELGVDDKQREAIVKEVQTLQGKVVEIQWKLHAAMADLVKLLDAPRVDEAQALAAADKLMGLEHEVKRLHLTALIRIRNLLTGAQRAKAASLRTGAAPRP